MFPFLNTIPEERRDRYLIDKLCKELPMILAWAAIGCLRWQRDEHCFTKVFRHSAEIPSSDPFSKFIRTSGSLCPDGRTKGTDLLAAYRDHCHQTNIKALGQQQFYEYIEQVNGIQRKIIHKTVYFTGIKLNT